MATLPEKCQQLEAAREATLRKIGKLNDKVLSRALPMGRMGQRAEMVPWPATMLGKQRMVRREQSVLIVTDGVSNPWDPTIHAQPVPDWKFGFEAALEVPLAIFKDASDDAIASSWLPTLLFAATDWIIAERIDLKGQLIRHGCVTIAVPSVRGLESLISASGFIGALVGIPYVGNVLETQVKLASDPDDPEDAIWLLPLKILTPDEYDWATGVRDSSRAMALGEAFLKRSTSHISWPSRKSILADLAL